MQQSKLTCQHPNCKESAFYGYRYGERFYCQNPSTSYFDRICLCGKSSPIFPNRDGINVYCKECKKDIECIGIHGKRCPINGKPLDKYGGYCRNCFIITFPFEAMIRYNKIKELRTFEFLVSKFPHLYFISDTIIDDTFTNRRIDIRTTIGDLFLAIEIDENQHKNRTHIDERNRYEELIPSIRTSNKDIKSIVFIRFNPDEYRNKRGVKVDNFYFDTRLSILEEHIKTILSRNTEPLEIHKLFYDGFDDIHFTPDVSYSYSIDIDKVPYHKKFEMIVANTDLNIYSEDYGINGFRMLQLLEKIGLINYDNIDFDDTEKLKRISDQITQFLNDRRMPHEFNALKAWAKIYREKIDIDERVPVSQFTSSNYGFDGLSLEAPMTRIEKYLKPSNNKNLESIGIRIVKIGDIDYITYTPI